MLVDDERVSVLAVTECSLRRSRHLAGPPELVPLSTHEVPVPSDDRLTHDVESAVSSLLWEAAALRHKATDEPMPDRTRGMYRKADALDASAARLRAAFDLDEGSE